MLKIDIVLVILINGCIFTSLFMQLILIGNKYVSKNGIYFNVGLQRRKETKFKFFATLCFCIFAFKIMDIQNK